MDKSKNHFEFEMKRTGSRTDRNYSNFLNVIYLHNVNEKGEAWSRFYQHVYVKLFRAQNPKVQKRQSCH